MPKPTYEGAGAAAGAAIGTAFGSPGAGAAIGGSIGSMFGGGETAREAENYERSKNLLGKGSKRALHNLYGRARKSISRGYSQAESKLHGIENAERQAIMNAQTQQIAEMDQRMTSRGLYNTSIGVGGGTEYQGILANTQQSLNDLSSRLASLYSNLYTSRGTELAGLAQNKFQARQQYVTDLTNFFSGQPITTQAPIDYGGMSDLFADAPWANTIGGEKKAASATNSNTGMGPYQAPN